MRLGKYHLRVTGRTAADVVAGAGGWLVDRAMAGWEVTVILLDDCDPAPLRILGVGTTPRDATHADDDTADGPLCSQSFAVSGPALIVDHALRADVVRAARTGVAEVTVWGRASLEVVPGLVAVEHVLSSAARAFKERALRAAGSAEPVVGVEFFGGRASVLDASYSDLTASAVATSFAQR